MTVALPEAGAGYRLPPAGPIRSADEREILGIGARIRSDHPDVPLEHIETAVRAALARTADAPVQIYRLVLAERDVRARLRAAGSRPRR